MPALRYVLSLLACLALLAGRTFAYNPPVDKVGPLTVRIEGPAEVAERNTPVPVRVVVENGGDEKIEGTVALGLVDAWQAAPDKPVAFAAEGKKTTTLEFAIKAGAETYPGHYPIHAWARFNSGGKPLVAHPILIFESKLSPPPLPTQPVEWKPFHPSENSKLALWRLPNARVVVQVFNQPAIVLPPGRQGAEPKTGGTMHVDMIREAGRPGEAVRIHPPWQNGQVGTLLAEYPVGLPKTGPIKLEFANAMQREGRSDGVTFRVRVLPFDAPAGEQGKVVFERHVTAKEWQPAQADLSAFAGQTVRIQLESHPGPKNDTGWDSSFWLEPTLVCGDPPIGPKVMPKEVDKIRRLGKAGRGETLFDVSVIPGWRGLLDATIIFEAPGRELRLAGFEATVLGQRLDDPRSPILLREIKDEPGEGYGVRHRFESHAGTFDLVGRLYVEQGVLRAKFQIENAPPSKPWFHVYLEDLACGPWSSPPDQMYAGEGNVIRRPGAFHLNFDGHQLATSFVGLDFGKVSMVEGVDVPPTNFQIDPAARRASLHVPHAQIRTLIPATNVWDGAKGWRETNGLKAAGGVQKAAGRFVFDLWGGQYAHLEKDLRRSFRYGLTDSMAIIHVWQRWGYDYRLPDIYPPDPGLGSLADMQSLLAACKQVGAPAAIHDNYIDLYPDAEGFSYDHIAFHADGTPVRAWLNEYRKAQSYRIRADRITPFLQRNLKLIGAEMPPTAYFIDVWSSIGPYDYWTRTGEFHDRIETRNTWGEHFSWIRDQLGGAPQISESGHDQLIGWLDGSQTNHLRVGKPGPSRVFGSWCVWDVPHGDAERTPWFDAAHHDRFVQHGAGYPGRYEGGLDSKLHGIYSDDYMSTEVLTGHPPMVSQAFGRDVVRKYWLLSQAMRALAGQKIESVEYVGGNLHHQYVRWTNGQAWVNRGEDDWDPATGAVIPPHGFSVAAFGSEGLATAQIVRERGVIVEVARGPQWTYVNSRQVIEDNLPIRVEAKEAKATGDRSFQVALQWQADEPVPEGYVPFVHFCDDEGEIVFQGGYSPGQLEGKKGTIAATVGAAMPESLMGKTVELRVGIFNPKTGPRLALAGPDDGTRRVRLGKLRFEAPGRLAWTPHKPEPNAWLARQNAADKPIDFHSVVARGGYRLTWQADALTVTPLPDRHRTKGEIRIRLSEYFKAGRTPKQVEVLDESGQITARKPATIKNGEIALTCEPEAFAYRLTE